MLLQVLALTAFDPPGTTRDRSSNAAANDLLWKDIKQLSLPPSCAWRSFGFDLEEGWREDGFCLAFDAARADAGRKAVVELARAHAQGAIFEYEFDAQTPRLLRRTLGACLDMPYSAATTLALVHPPFPFPSFSHPFHFCLPPSAPNPPSSPLPPLLQLP